MADGEWLTIGQAAQLAGLSPQTIRRYENAGLVLAHRTPGNQRRFKREDIETLLTPPAVTSGAQAS